jgi:hypothetical protein
MVCGGVLFVRGVESTGFINSKSETAGCSVLVCSDCRSAMFMKNTYILLCLFYARRFAAKRKKIYYKIVTVF